MPSFTWGILSESTFFVKGCVIDYLPEVYLAQSLQPKAAEHWGDPGSRTQRLGRRAFRVGGVKPFGWVFVCCITTH